MVKIAKKITKPTGYPYVCIAFVLPFHSLGFAVSVAELIEAKKSKTILVKFFFYHRGIENTKNTKKISKSRFPHLHFNTIKLLAIEKNINF